MWRGISVQGTQSPHIATKCRYTPSGDCTSWTGQHQNIGRPGALRIRKSIWWFGPVGQRYGWWVHLEQHVIQFTGNKRGLTGASDMCTPVRHMREINKSIINWRDWLVWFQILTCHNLGRAKYWESTIWGGLLFLESIKLSMSFGKANFVT